MTTSISTEATNTVDTLIDRIANDLTTLRTLIAPKKVMPIAQLADRLFRDAPVPTSAVATTIRAVRIPALKGNYTKAGARSTKRKIDAAFEAGNITYDKRRGLKMLVTKRTKGWSAITRAA